MTEHPPSSPLDGDDDDFTYQPALAAEPEQVSSAIAIIRIVAVLAMGICVSLGLFLLLIGGPAIIVGVVLLALAAPVYVGMQFAERVAGGEKRAAR